MIPSLPSALSIFCGVFTTADYTTRVLRHHDDLEIWKFGNVEILGMGIFRKTEGEPLAVTMTGVKLGDRFLSVGVRDRELIAVLAAKAGLTGTACAVDADEAAVKSAAAAIEAAGALAEVTRAPWGQWPYSEGSFDVALIRDVLPALTQADRSSAVAQVLRVLRPGGRVIVIDGTGRGSFGWIKGGAGTRPAAAAATQTLKDAGFAAVRVLAETDGVSYVEGIKKA
jgi:SAM-dependent methyltransferase